MPIRRCAQSHSAADRAPSLPPWPAHSRLRKQRRACDADTTDVFTTEQRQRSRFSTVVLKGNTIMLSTVIVVLLVLWLLGMATSYTLGGVIHLLLVIAIIVVLLRIIQGRSPLRG
jgi:Family of unknown function (DUF5670)